MNLASIDTQKTKTKGRKGTDIDTPTFRKDLTPHKEPRWKRIIPGLYIGFRKLAPKGQQGGSWIARQRTQDGKQHFQALGNESALGWAEAHSAAQKWGEETMDGVGRSKIKTVRDICHAYVKERRAEKGDKNADAADSLYKRHVYNRPIADIKLKDLETIDVKTWRASLPESLKNDTKDHALKILRAALNYGLKELKIVGKDRAEKWQCVELFKENNKRKLVLNKNERMNLINHAPLDAQPFMHALCKLPIRPGALAKLKVEDLHDKTPGYEYLFVDEDKANGQRDVPLDANTLAFLRLQCKGKFPQALMFMDAAGNQWNKNSWKEAFKKARAAAKMDRKTCAYTLRHSIISDMISVGGMDVLIVAEMAGTSLQQINNYYGKPNHEIARKKLAACGF